MQCMLYINLRRPAKLQEQIRVVRLLSEEVSWPTHGRGLWARPLTRLRAVLFLLLFLFPFFPHLCETFACACIYVHRIKFTSSSNWVSRNGNACAANKRKIFLRAHRRVCTVFFFFAAAILYVRLPLHVSMWACVCRALGFWFAQNICTWYFNFASIVFCINFICFILLQRNGCSSNTCTEKVCCGYTGVNVYYLARVRVSCK